MSTADNIQQWTYNGTNGPWKTFDSTISWADSDADRIKVLEEALMTLADIMDYGVDINRIKMFLEIMKDLRVKEAEEEIEDHIDKELFEINDDF